MDVNLVRRSSAFLKSPNPLGGLVAINTNVSSLKTLPGARSISLAKSFRAAQRARIIARAPRSLILWIPEVLRHGSFLGGGGGAFRIAAKSALAHSNFPLSIKSF
jgi:hypothetical protein